MDSNHNQYIGQYIADVIEKASQKLLTGDLADYVPIPTNLQVLDNVISGGLRKTELILLGGAQGVGKTIASLQIARNIALQPGQHAYYLSFEHTEIHLMHRLLCLESAMLSSEFSDQITLKTLYNMISSSDGKETLRQNVRGGLQQLLEKNPKTAPAFRQIKAYGNKLILAKASSQAATLSKLRENIKYIYEHTQGNVTVFIDYLQKIAVDEPYKSDEEKVTIIVEGLKDLAMTLDVPIFAVVSADREGLKSDRIHLYHFRGSSALDYECDIAIIMSNKFRIAAKDIMTNSGKDIASYRNWIVFSVEKNRAGRAFIDVEYEVDGAHFRLRPETGRPVRDRLIDDGSRED